MNPDPAISGFDSVALQHAAAASSDINVTLRAFEAELEKIAWNPLNAFSNLMDATRSGWNNVRASWHGIDPQLLSKLDRKAAVRSYMEQIDPEGRWAAKWLKPGAGTPTPTPTPGGPSFMNTQFGLDQLQAPAGSAPGAGLKNWWSNTTDVQKLKTLGAAGLGLGAAGVAANAATGGMRPPQINMGPTLTGY